jgi:predicted nucleotidyltransferase
MTLEQRLREKRREILRIAAEHGARNVRVFGSVARGEADETSDIDFLVSFQPGRSLPRTKPHGCANRGKRSLPRSCEVGRE